MTDWFRILRDDAQELQKSAWKRITDVEKLLDSQIDLDSSDENYDRKERNARAREVARFSSEIAMLAKPPRIDVRHETGIDDETSGAIEEMLSTIATRTKLQLILARANRICAFAPFAMIKVGTSGTQRTMDVGIVAQQNKSVAGPMLAVKAALEDLPPGIDLADIPLAGDDIIETTIPTINSINLPWVEECDPRHIIMPTNIKNIESAYYIAHLFLRTPAECERLYGKRGTPYRINARSNDITVQGVSFSALTPAIGHDNCLLAEVYIVKDPNDPGTENVIGVMDFVSGKWLTEPVAYDGPMRFAVLRADSFHPRLWDAPSHIEQVWSDIEDLSFIRKQARMHVEWSAQDAMWLPKDSGIAEEILAEIDRGVFKRKVVEYDGRIDPSKSHTRQIPVALLQWQQFAEQRFTQNSGASAAARGAGETNKVATAFNIEAQFIDSRRALMLQRIHESYTDVLLIAAHLVAVSDGEINLQANGIQFTIMNKVIRGITGFEIDLIADSANDPLADKMVLMQILREVLSNPAMAQYYNLAEVAKQLAKIMRWPSRTLAQQGGGAGAGAETVAAAGSSSGTPQGVGMGVDTAPGSMQTTTSVQGNLQ